MVSEEVGLRLGAGLVGVPVEVGNAFAGQHVLAQERLPRAVAARLGDHRVCRVGVQFGPARPCHRLDVGSEKALATAKERGWTVVSMQNDFKVVFGL